MVELLRGRTGHYVFASSTVIYAASRVLPIREDFPVDRSERQNEYGLGKILCEDILIREHRERGFPATTVAFSMVFGPHNILPDREQRMFVRLRRGRPVLIPGDGTTLGQVGHVDDQARALRLLMGNPKTSGPAYTGPATKLQRRGLRRHLRGGARRRAAEVFIAAARTPLRGPCARRDDQAHSTSARAPHDRGARLCALRAHERLAPPCILNDSGLFGIERRKQASAGGQSTLRWRVEQPGAGSRREARPDARLRCLDGESGSSASARRTGVESPLQSSRKNHGRMTGAGGPSVDVEDVIGERMPVIKNRPRSRRELPALARGERDIVHARAGHVRRALRVVASVAPALSDLLE